MKLMLEQELKKPLRTPHIDRVERHQQTLIIIRLSSLLHMNRGLRRSHFWQMLEKIPNELIEEDEQYGLRGIKDEPWYLYDPERFMLLSPDSEIDTQKELESVSDQVTICYGMVNTLT